ncbi:MAG: hypothetical protein GY820_05885 [Gammaproteobacteria bacterium]|nr:hypothetical protein [Gammaproteobacteria bacterium]
MPKLLRGLRNPKTHMGLQAGRGQLWVKISIFLNKPKTMLVGALRVASGLLRSRIFFRVPCLFVPKAQKGIDKGKRSRWFDDGI